MDENYLDSLLREVSSGDKKNNNFDNMVEADSGIDIDMSDLGNISIDELDELDSLDLEDFDFDDIDFDDVDVTKLDSKDSGAMASGASSAEDENFNLDGLISGLAAEDEVYNNEDEASENDKYNDEEDDGGSDGTGDETLDDVFNDADIMFEQDMSLSDMFGDVGEPKADMPEVNADEADDGVLDEAAINNMDLDDLFSALGIESENSDRSTSEGATEKDSFDELFENAIANNVDSKELDAIKNIEEIKGTKKRRTREKNSGEEGPRRSISELLFGEPDEDDIEEEKLFNIKKAEKEQLKEKKKAEKEAKNGLKKERLELKKKEDAKKKSDKAARKRAEAEALQAELAGEKKVSTPIVFVVFVAVAVLGVFVIFGTREFNYSQVIRKAADYFDRQRYRLAYDEVAGVEVRQDDEDLRDRIYTVMYVERLYESYENNMVLGRPDKALDALLRGLGKYDEHYDEAVSLQIVEDINYCKDKIINALWNTYGLTEEQANKIMELTGQEYMHALNESCAGLETGE